MSLVIMATCVALAFCFTPALGAAATVSSGRPLRGNDTMVSAQGKFELGLFSPAGSSGGRFYLGIWYKNIPGQTVIWVGNRASPLSAVMSAELCVSADDGNLELVGLTGASASPVVLWSSNLSSSPGSNTAHIRDDGNLVLVHGGNSSNVLWQSFDHQTDTMLPGAWIGENKLTGEYQALTSWRNAQDPAPGMFCDTVDPNGTSEFFYLWNRSRAYWRTGVWTGRAFARLPEARRYNTTYVETPAYRRLTSVLYDNATITRMVLGLTGQTKLYIWVLLGQTKNFSERLGGGGFGSVYRGVLKQHKGDNTTQVQVAVKKLESLGQGDKQFRTEVTTLGCIQHVNLVRLLGFCASGDEKMLVYEYIYTQRLPRRLSLRRRRVPELAPPVLHHGRRGERVDLPARRLPRAHHTLRRQAGEHASCWTRIADFGMAKLVGRDLSRALTTMRGTIGYLAPEWISGQPISAKADVYSFGMVLFELISGRRNSEGYSESEVDAAGSGNGDSWTFFPVWAAGKVVEGEMGAVADPRLLGNVRPEELERACRVACWCIQDEEAQRPTMAQVVQALEGAVHVHAPPMPRALQHLVN